MSLKIYLLRRSETEYSQRGAFCGNLDVELTPQGVQMAEHFAAAYRTIPWTAIYTSPMICALATARPLSDAVGMPLQVHDGLREFAYGEWEDREQDEIRQHYPEDYLRWQTDPAWNPPTGGETAMQIASRALPVINEIESTHSTRHTWWSRIKRRSGLFFAACSVSTSAAIATESIRLLLPFPSLNSQFTDRCSKS